MAMFTTTPDVSGILPETIGVLIVEPVERESVAFTVSAVVPTASTDYRVPVVTDDPSAQWTAEGADITASDATMAELTITPRKLAGLTIISRELAEDSSPEAQAVVGAGLARDIARKVDAAFFAATTSNGPAGLLSLSGTQSVDTGGTIADLDPFAEALSLAESEGATVGHFVANPLDVLTLARLRKASGSNEPLLGGDPTAPSVRTVLGVPLLSSPAVAAGDIWALPTPEEGRVQVVVRQDTSLDVDASRYFDSDRIAVRATMRIGYAFPHEAAVVRLHDTSGA